MGEHLAVIDPGMQSTLQDFGRYGFQRYGISAAGAIDVLSMQIANALVGNARDEGRLGTHDDEIDGEEPRQPEQALCVVGSDGMAGREGRDPGIARRSMELRQLGRRREPPRESVLPTPRADDEDAHRSV